MTFTQLCNRIKYRKHYQEMKYQLAIHNEKVQMAVEIKKYGRIRLTGTTE